MLNGPLHKIFEPVISIKQPTIWGPDAIAFSNVPSLTPVVRGVDNIFDKENL
jgi:hypothetical protein